MTPKRDKEMMDFIVKQMIDNRKYTSHALLWASTGTLTSPNSNIKKKEPKPIKIGFWTKWKQNAHAHFKKKALNYLDEALVTMTRPNPYRRYIVKRFSNFTFKNL